MKKSELFIIMVNIRVDINDEYYIMICINVPYKIYEIAIVIWNIIIDRKRFKIQKNICQTTKYSGIYIY